MFRLSLAAVSFSTFAHPRWTAPGTPGSSLVDAFPFAGRANRAPGAGVVVLLLVAVTALNLVVTVTRRQQFRMADLHPPLVEP